MNIFNPALVVRAFLFFAYPAQISGDRVWVALDGYSAASPLAVVAEGAEAPVVDVLAAQGVTWWNSFIGLIPGSIGETSTLAILLGIGLLLITGVGSWRIMLSMLIGGVVMAAVLNLAASPSGPLPGTADPLSPDPGRVRLRPRLHGHRPGLRGRHRHVGKWIYGFLVGVLSILVRILNPAFPEGVMLAILFMNMFAPLIDHFVVRSNVKKRLARSAGRARRPVRRSAE